MFFADRNGCCIVVFYMIYKLMLTEVIIGTAVPALWNEVLTVGVALLHVPAVD
jgi:hypothetical protein